MVATIQASTSALRVVVATPHDSYPYILEISAKPIGGERQTRIDPIIYPPLVEVRVSGEGNARDYAMSNIRLQRSMSGRC
jgi:hypothetical protein